MYKISLICIRKITEKIIKEPHLANISSILNLIKNYYEEFTFDNEIFIESTKIIKK